MSEVSSTNIAEDSLVWPQWKKMCLIFDKLEAPGKEEPRKEKGRPTGVLIALPIAVTKGLPEKGHLRMEGFALAHS